MKILITGFESREDKSNASDILVTSLINDIPKELEELSCETIMKVVGDDTHTLKSEVAELLKIHEPNYCLFTGQAPSRNKITFECIATNYRYLASLPEIGQSPDGCEIEENGADAYLSTIPNVSNIIQDIKSEVIPAALSRWSGNSLCV